MTPARSSSSKSCWPKATLAEIADHPEITLSRREILRFILIEPTKRSEEIQTILKLEDIGQTRADGIGSDLTTLEKDPGVLAALQRRAFIEKGLDLVDGPECPLCDKPWDDEQHLREHLRAKLAKSDEARKIQEALLKKGTAVAQAAIGVSGLLAQTIAEGQGDGGFR